MSTEPYPEPSIPEARRFEQRMSRVIDAGLATSFREAEEVLIANEIAPPVPISRQVDYISEKPDLVRQVMYGEGPVATRRKMAVEEDHEMTISGNVMKAAGYLERAYGKSRPAEGAELIQPMQVVAEISQALDEGLPVSIGGYSRQGKTSLAYIVGQARQQEVIRINAQGAVQFWEYGLKSERPMERGASRANDERIGAIIDHYQGDSPPDSLWSGLNEYAQQEGVRLLICFDELGTLTDEKYVDAVPLVKHEIAEIVEASNLDLITIEHVGAGKFIGDRIDILPPEIQRFMVPPVTGPQMYDYLRSITGERRVSFAPEAVAEIHALSGGWPSLAALVGSEVIKHHAAQPTGRFIYSEQQVRAWEEDYVQKGMSENDSIITLLYDTFGSLDPEQQLLVESMAQSEDGIALDNAPNSEVDFLVRTGLVVINTEASRAQLSSRLLRRAFPYVKGMTELAALKKKLEGERAESG